MSFWASSARLLLQLAQTLEARGYTVLAITDLAAAELEALDRRKAAMAARKAADEETLSRIEVEITPRALDAYFAGSHAFKGLRTQSIEHVLGGYSKDTYLLSTLSEEGARRDIVLRRDLPFGPTERSAADEFDVLLRPAADTALTRLLPNRARNYRTTVITNAGVPSGEEVERSIAAGAVKG